jgi:hypothetical protein
MSSAIVVQVKGHIIDPDDAGPCVLVIEVEDESTGKLYSVTVGQPR